jgi:hypothetical protein
MTPEECAAAAKPAVSDIGGLFMVDQATRDRGAALGIKAWPFYYGGRGGVLGDVDADVVAASFVFFPPDRLRSGWEKALAVRPAAELAAEFALACHDWGRRHLAGAPQLEELAELLERIVQGAPVSAAPLFAGWRAMPLPDDPPARVAQLLHVLREQRGGAHTVAVLASGLAPLEAVICGEGEGQAEFFGWQPPYPGRELLRDRYAPVEDLTNRLLAPAYGQLSETERKQLGEYVVVLTEHVS